MVAAPEQKDAPRRARRNVERPRPETPAIAPADGLATAEGSLSDSPENLGQDRHWVFKDGRFRWIAANN